MVSWVNLAQYFLTERPALRRAIAELDAPPPPLAVADDVNFLALVEAASAASPTSELSTHVLDKAIMSKSLCF